MANRTAWTAGNGVGFTWTTAINGSDLASLANGSTVLSSVADIAKPDRARHLRRSFGPNDRDLGDPAGRGLFWAVPGGVARRRGDLWRRLPDIGQHYHPRASLDSCWYHPARDRGGGDLAGRVYSGDHHPAGQLPVRPLHQLGRSAKRDLD